MIYTEKKFDMMLESSWRAFESTLMLHGMSKAEIQLFNQYMEYRYVKELVEDELSRVVEFKEENQ